jgi:7-cyano-7-deazaguanine reductase
MLEFVICNPQFVKHLISLRTGCRVSGIPQCAIHISCAGTQPREYLLDRARMVCAVSKGAFTIRGDMATPRYTDEHAKAGLDHPFPEIETWPNQFPAYEIVVDVPEFTSVCPKTGLPDFGVITIRYMPDQRCLELKSLKEYLFEYRNLGIFQENIVNRVLEDIVRAAKPVWAVVRGEFRPRGGIGTVIEAKWPRPEKNVE